MAWLLAWLLPPLPLVAARVLLDLLGLPLAQALAWLQAWLLALLLAL